MKGLPKSATNESLTSHLNKVLASPTITDCFILKTPAGASRGIAFVGFAESTTTKTAVSTLHRSFFGTSKLTVEIARSRNDDNTTGENRPWSKYSEGSSRYKSTDGGDKSNKNKRPSPATTNASAADANQKKQRKDDFISAILDSGNSGKKNKKMASHLVQQDSTAR